MHLRKLIIKIKLKQKSLIIITPDNSKIIRIQFFGLFSGNILISTIY